MVSSLDGRATIAARSGGLSDAADRALFRGMRAITDAVLVGAGTARSEHYGRMIRDPAVRHARKQAGRTAEPLACVVTSRLALDSELPLLNEPEARVVIVTASAASLPPVPAEVQYVRAAGPDGQLDLGAALRELLVRLHVREVLCEGGPSLNAQLLAVGLVDELFLSLAPVLAGGEDVLRIVAPSDALAPTRLELEGLLTAESQLFLRYRVTDADALT
jgi:riboflavin biosynthesis pyrimidine reductase